MAKCVETKYLRSEAFIQSMKLANKVIALILHYGRNISASKVCRLRISKIISANKLKKLMNSREGVKRSARLGEISRMSDCQALNMKCKERRVLPKFCR
jgi:hypothetical protein